MDFTASSNTIDSCPSEVLKNEEDTTLFQPPDLDGFELSIIDFKTDRSSNQSKNTVEKSGSSRKNLKSTGRSRRIKKSLPKRSFVRKERHVIQHNYHDHADDVIDFDEYTSDLHGLESPLKKKGGVAVPFPLKLHELLDKVHEEGQQHIVSWQPHGRAFVVRQPKTFVEDLMPRFFRQTKLTSFQRQLNLYGFSRLTRGPDAGGYYHELFLRGKPHLTRRMIRTKIKGTGYKAASNPACEPDFYNMKSVGPRLTTSHGNNDDSYFTCTEMLNATQAPIVTPIADSGQSKSKELSSFAADDLGVPIYDMSTSMSTSASAPEKPFLKPRHHARAVQMGNQHFHYMESLNRPPRPDYSVSNEEKYRSESTPSPILFERMSSEEASIKGSEDDPSQDPLAIFLADMGGSFEDDLLFTCDDKNDANEETKKPSIYEV